MMAARRLASLVAILLAARASAQAFPARSGETGILDVPDAELAGRDAGQLAAELRLDSVDGKREFGPLPIYAVAGVADRLDLGFTMREGGQPGDPRPSNVLFGAAAKLQLWAPRGSAPGLALGGVLDRFNARPVAGARLALSTGGSGFRIAAFAGAELEISPGGTTGPTAGVAASVPLVGNLHLAAEALTGPRGENFGGALRWSGSKSIGASLGANYFPGDGAFRISLTLAFAPARAKPAAATPAAGPDAPVEETVLPGTPQFADDRPHFRLRIPIRGPLAGDPAHLQHGATTLRTATATAAAPVARPEVPGTRAVAPSLEDLAETQLGEQESLAAARERRIRSTADALDAREKAMLDQRRQLGERERALADREQQLDGRERRLAVRGPPTQQQRQLESLEAQLASQERSLAAQEKSYGPALDAAEGRERDAAAREEAERAEATRLAAAVSAAPSRSAQLDVRKQALASRNRQLAALEARLVAKGESIDGLDRQLRTRSERVDAWSRRLDTRTERLDLLENLGAPPKAPAAPKPAPAPTGAAPATDKAAFVMVVKAPTAVVKERPAAAGGSTAGPAVRSGVAVEKAVAAATVLMFPTPASQLSELDAEALANIAKLAAREGCELLIWARAQDPGAMAEAQRRATDIQTRALAAAPLDASRVVTRVTTRPGARGVDVVVSALRETAKPAAAPAAPETPKLLPGESGTRQLREAVQVAQSSIEACVAAFVESRRLSRAEGVLKLMVGATGRVTRVVAGAGDVAGSDIEECLNSASRTWLFPSADGEYVVDVPITVMRGGTAR